MPVLDSNAAGGLDRKLQGSPGCVARGLGTVSALRRGFLSKYLLKLYITGTNPRTELAIANLKRICETELEGEYSLEIIDVIEDPEAAEQDRILATPTLIKQLPPPLRRVIGDLSDRDKVLFGLQVQPGGKTPPSAPRET